MSKIFIYIKPNKNVNIVVDLEDLNYKITVNLISFKLRVTYGGII